MKSILILLSLLLILSQPIFSFGDIASGEEIEKLITRARSIQEETPDKALLLFNEALKLAEAEDKLRERANILNYIGIIYYNRKDYSTSITHFQQSLKVLFRLSNKEKVANMMKKIGLAYLNQKKYVKAIEYYNLALKVFEQINHIRRQAETHQEIGVMYRLAERYNDAISEFDKSLVYYEQLGNKTGQAEVVHHQAKTFQEMGSLNQAVDYFKKTLQLYEKYLGNNGVAVVYNNYGRTLVEMNKYDLAKEILEKAKEQCRDTNSVLYGRISANYGAVLVYKSKYKDAEKNLQRALNVLSENNNEKFKAQVYRMLYELNFRNNDTRQALSYYQKYIAVKDTAGVDNMPEFKVPKGASTVDNILIFVTVFGSLVILALIISLVYVIRQRDRAMEELNRLKKTNE